MIILFLYVWFMLLIVNVCVFIFSYFTKKIVRWKDWFNLYGYIWKQKKHTRLVSSKLGSAIFLIDTATTFCFRKTICRTDTTIDTSERSRYKKHSESASFFFVLCKIIPCLILKYLWRFVANVLITVFSFCLVFSVWKSWHFSRLPKLCQEFYRCSAKALRWVTDEMIEAANFRGSIYIMEIHSCP